MGLNSALESRTFLHAGVRVDCADLRAAVPSSSCRARGRLLLAAANSPADGKNFIGEQAEMYPFQYPLRRG